MAKKYFANLLFKHTMGNSNIIPLNRIDIIKKNNIREFDKDKIILETDNKMYPCIALYFRDDIKEECFRILQEIKENEKDSIIGIKIFHYNSKIFAIHNKQQCYYSKCVILESDDHCIDIRRVL